MNSDNISRISSLANQRIKDVVRLRNRNFRQQQGLSIVEGQKELMCALDGGMEIKEIYVKETELAGYDVIRKKISTIDTNVFSVTSSVYEKMAFGNRDEGLLAVIKCKVNGEIINIPALKAERSVLIVITELEKPGNLGAILRTCDGAGVDGVIVCDRDYDLYNPNVIRASLGTVFSVPIAVVSEQQAYDWICQQGYKICAALPDAKLSYTQVSFDSPVALVVGREDKGINEFWQNNAAIKMKIPMRGKADSLNVSVSVGILVYEALRQKLT